MKVRTLSRHFVHHWCSWRGDFPSLEEVNNLIDTGQQLRPQLQLFKRRPDGTYQEFVVLAEHWNHGAGVVLRVDERDGTAVTIIAAGRRKEFQPFRRDSNGQSAAKNRQ